MYRQSLLDPVEIALVGDAAARPAHRDYGLSAI